MLTGTVGYFVLALLARRLFRPIRLGSPVTGCRGLAERLMELVPDGTRNVTAFHLADGKVRFAGLGFDECTSVEIGSVGSTQIGGSAPGNCWLPRRTPI